MRRNAFTITIEIEEFLYTHPKIADVQVIVAPATPAMVRKVNWGT
ncbi:MAG: hypothetical protein AABZ58_03110 [Chloroflexota bacterium]